MSRACLSCERCSAQQRGATRLAEEPIDWSVSQSTGVAFAWMRAPPPDPEGHRRVALRSSSPPRDGRADRRGPGADRRGGGRAGGDQSVRRGRQFGDAGGDDRGRDRQRPAGPGRDARLPAGGDPEHDPDQRAGSDRRRGRRGPCDPSAGSGRQAAAGHGARTGRRLAGRRSPRRCSLGRQRGSRCWSAVTAPFRTPPPRRWRNSTRRAAVPPATVRSIPRMAPRSPRAFAPISSTATLRPRSRTRSTSSASG